MPVRPPDMHRKTLPSRDLHLERCRRGKLAAATFRFLRISDIQESTTLELREPGMRHFGPAIRFFGLGALAGMASSDIRIPGVLHGPLSLVRALA